MTIENEWKSIHDHLNDLIAVTLFYGRPDTADSEEAAFERWFVATFRDFPIPGKRLPDPQFQGLRARYTSHGN